MKSFSRLDYILRATDAPYLLAELAEYHKAMEAFLRDARHAQQANLTPDSDEGRIKASLQDKYQHTFANLLGYSIMTIAYGICEPCASSTLHAREREHELTS